MGTPRQPSGQQEPVGVGDRHGRRQQRVVCRAQTGGTHVTARRGQALGPVAAALEGVRGQVGAAGAGALEVGLPLDGHAAGVQTRQRGGERLGLGAAGAQHGERGGDAVGGGVRVRGQAGLGHGGQDAVGAQFEEGGGAVAVEPGEGVGEPYGVAGVVHPVVGGGQLLHRGEGARQAGDDRDHGCLRGEPGDGRAELRQHGFHERGVERVRDTQPLGPAAQRVEVLGDGGDVVGLTGDYDGGGPVDRGDREAVGPVLQEGQDLFLGGFEGDHGAAFGQRLHEAAAGEHQGRGVGQGEDAGDVRRGDFADGVPGEEVRRDAEGLGEPVQRDLDREQRGLGIAGLVQQGGLGRALGGEQDVLQGPFKTLVEVAEDLVEGGGEDGEAGGQFTPHARPLGALAREEEGELGPGTGGVLHQTRGRCAVGERGEGGAGAVRAGRGERGAVLQAGAGRGQGVGHVQGREAGAGGEVFEQSRRLGTKRLAGAAGDEPRDGARRQRFRDRRGVFLARLGRRGGRGLLQNGVRIGAAEPERRNTGPARLFALRPRNVLGEQAYGPLRPVDVRGRRVHMERAREHAVPHRQHHLDDAGHTGRRLGVAEVRFDGPQQQRAVVVAALAVGRQQRLGLDRVAQGGAGAVCLDDVDLIGREPRADQRLLDHPSLRGAVGCGQPVGGAVLVDGGAADHGQDLVPVATGLREAFQDQDADALGPAGAVGGVGEGAAAPVGGEPALAVELHEGGGAGHHGDAGGKRQGALALAQGVGGQVQGHERGRAGGVDGDRRAHGAEEVGESARDDAGGGARQGEALDVVVRAHPVFLGHRPDEHARPGAPDRRRVDAGPLEGFPGGLQQQSLLRVHGERLTGRDPEEGGVELGRVVQESAGEFPRVLGQELPAAVGGGLGDAVPVGGEQGPELLGTAHAAREAAAHAHDRDRLAGRRLQLAHPLPGAPQIGTCPL